MLSKKILYFILVLLIIIIIFIPHTRNAAYGVLGDFFYPFISMVTNFQNYAEKKSSLTKSKAELIEELTELKKENYILSAKTKIIDTLREDNDKLHSLLKLKSSSYYNYIFAEIISRDPIKWFQEFIINKGKKDGLRNGTLIIAGIVNEKEKNELEFGVVGRISAVSKHSAVVDTIINKDCRLSVTIPENGATGILTGGGRSGNDLWTEVNYLPRDLTYRAGSVVKTSGLNDFTPPALLVGTISENMSDIKKYSDLYTEIKLKPAVNFNQIKYVLALVKND